MTDSSKKVEVRFGAFACTIEGYDDPVAQMREVLGMMQRMISETPALAEAAEFNADEVKDALKEGDSTPGVVVIRSADTPEDDAPSTDTETSEADTKDAADVKASVQDAAVVADSKIDDAVEVASAAAEDAKDAVADAATAVAEKATDAPEGTTVTASAVDNASDAVEGVFADVQETVADATDDLADVAQDTADTVGETLANIVPENKDADQSASGDQSGTDGLLSGAVAAAAALGTGTVASQVLSDEASELSSETQPSPEQPAASSTAAWLAERRAETEVESSTSAPEEIATDLSEEDGLSDFQDAIQEAAAETSLEPDPVQIEPDPVVPEPEPVLSDPEVTHPETAPSDETAEDVPFNIFAAPPSPDPVEPLIQTAGSEAVQDNTDLDQEDTDPTDVLIEGTAVEASPVEEAPAQNYQAEIQGQTEPESVNIFAAASTPDPIVAPEPVPEPAHEPEVVADPTSVEHQSPVNIFAHPSTPSAEVIETKSMDTGFTAQPPVDQPPIPVEEIASAPEPAPISHPEPEEAAADFNIFASPSAPAAVEPDHAAVPNVQETQDTFQPEVLAEPAQEPEPVPSPEPAPAPEKPTSAFSSLLKRVQSGGMMSAPGEARNEEPAPAAAPTQGVSAADFVAKTQSTQVSDILAGSAAWLTLVQNKAKFTRREVMEVFDTIPGEHPKTLEARIKGFGKLVRSGTLILIDDGVFAMAQNERDRFQQYLS